MSRLYVKYYMCKGIGRDLEIATKVTTICFKCEGVGFIKAPQPVNTRGETWNFFVDEFDHPWLEEEIDTIVHGLKSKNINVKEGG